MRGGVAAYNVMTDTGLLCGGRLLNSAALIEEQEWLNYKMDKHLPVT